MSPLAQGLVKESLRRERQARAREEAPQPTRYWPSDKQDFVVALVCTHAAAFLFGLWL